LQGPARFFPNDEQTEASRCQTVCGFAGQETVEVRCLLRPGTGGSRASATPPRFALRKCVERRWLLLFCAFGLLCLFWFCVFRSLCLLWFCVSSCTTWFLRAEARGGCHSAQQKPAQQTNSHVSLPSLKTFPGRGIEQSGYWKFDVGTSIVRNNSPLFSHRHGNAVQEFVG
jgi:hypothetical protein